MRDVSFTMIADRQSGLTSEQVKGAVIEICGPRGAVVMSNSQCKLFTGVVATDLKLSLPGDMTIADFLNEIHEYLVAGLVYTTPIMGQVVLSRYTEAKIQEHLGPWKAKQVFHREVDPSTVYETFLDICCDYDEEAFISKYGMMIPTLDFFKRSDIKFYGAAAEGLSKCLGISAPTIHNLQSSMEDWARRPK